MASVWGELKRRNVVKVAVAYAIVGWLLIEVSSVLGPALSLPDWITSSVAFFLILGFPIALILSWAYELTPDGMERTKSIPLSESITKVTGRKLDFVIIGVLAIAVAFFAVDRFVLDTSGPFAGADIDPASLDAELDEPPSTAAEPTPAIAEEQQREVLPNSVAVLPFRNDSPDPDNAYYASGIHEEILNHLVKLSALNVIARTSVEQYANTDKSIPEIASELNVETVMGGSVRYAGGRIRITTQLNDGTTGVHLWSETYTRDFDDIFAIESDIAMNVANALEAEFSLEEQASIEKIPTDSPEAYALYLRALAFRGGGTAEYEQLAWSDDLDRAIALDPEFALAYARKAYLYTINFGTASEEWQSIVRNNAQRALRLDPTLSVAYIALATLYQLTWQWTDAEQAFERAAELSPNDSDVLNQYALFKRDQGDYAEALQISQRAVSLNPNEWFLHHQLGVSYRLVRSFAAAAAAHRAAIALNPAASNPHVGLAQSEAMRGNNAEALEQLQIAEQLGAGSTTFRLAQMAVVYSHIDRPEDSVRLLRTLEQVADETPYSDPALALAYIAVGDYQLALQHLEQAVNTQSSERISLGTIKSNYWGDPVLDQPRFQELRDRIGAF